MPTTNDYHITKEFRMGGNSQGAVAAPATARMMGKHGSATSNSTTPNGDSGLMPAVELSHETTGKSSGAALKQFHRKSLGDWDFLETVGAGSMGKVKLAKHKYTGEMCAIKIVNRATKAFMHKEAQLPAPKTQEEMMERERKLDKEISRDKRTIRESSLGQILYHPHICRLFEMCTMSNHFYMLFEYVSGGQLLDYIIQHGSLRERNARKFARGIASALQYLHSNNIVHRDLKIENIMISTSGEIKIIDFGLSNMYDPKKQLHTFCGSLYFAAPELLKACPYVGPEVDVWSFGVVLYVLVCGKVPFDDENSSVLHEKIKQGKVDYPQHLSIEVISLLSKMLVVDPFRRATLKQVVNHQWMQRGYDFPVPSYVMQRVPLTPEMLDASVIKEMYRLEFIDDIVETTAWLTSLISSSEYRLLSKQYWDTVNQSTQHFEDPTRAYHPLLSIYYLVDEMLRRKLAKQKKRAAVSAQDKSRQSAELPAVLENDARGASQNKVPKQYISIPEIPSNKRIAEISPAKNLPAIMVPPKLAIPEQAHTSPTNRRPSEIQSASVDLDNVLSPTPQSNDFDQTTAATMQTPTEPSSGSAEKSKFGTILRKLSQRRHNQVPATQHVNPDHKISQLQSPSEMPANNRKTHTRAVSEYAPTNFPSYDSTSTATQNESFFREHSNLPALPTNAANLIQNEQKLQGDMQSLSIADEDKPLPLLGVPKGRKMHPSARAKSVGHARRESLKYMRPPVPYDYPVPNDVNDDGFLENSDDGRSDYMGNVESANGVNTELTDQQVLELAAKAPPGSMPSIDFPRSLFLKGFFSVQTTSSKPLPVVRYKIISVLKKLNIEFKEVKGGFVCLHTQSYVSPNQLHGHIQRQQQPAIVVNDASSTGSDGSTHRRNMSIPGRQGSVSRQSSLRRQTSVNHTNHPSISATPIAAGTHERKLSVVSPTQASGSVGEISAASLELLHQDDILTTSKAQDMNRIDNEMVTNAESKERPPLKFEIHIVKVRIVGLAGIHFKKVSGNTWMYKELASHILRELNL
ncbi:LAMI_0H15962g1_1 [Lachancea mirantina]|uniref:non-specific serine/threonine protein kinase n=1 Tax=Lachancea mirantina TaxID=1230905 RepID=A0A1G4KIM4_9SACH|nr:LAMI_0H15962g1_1 [Lachancea mirantina]